MVNRGLALCVEPCLLLPQSRHRALLLPACSDKKFDKWLLVQDKRHDFGALSEALARLCVQTPLLLGMIQDTSPSVVGPSAVGRLKFGKRIEYWVMSLLLREGFDVFVPLVDDHGIDAVILGSRGKAVSLQIKAVSKNVEKGTSAFFAAISHPRDKKNHYFLFYVERLDLMWLMSSEDFLCNSRQDRSWEKFGTRNIRFHQIVKGKEYQNKKLCKWLITTEDKKHDFSTLLRALSQP